MLNIDSIDLKKATIEKDTNLKDQEDVRLKKLTLENSWLLILEYYGDGLTFDRFNIVRLILDISSYDKEIEQLQESYGIKKLKQPMLFTELETELEGKIRDVNQRKKNAHINNPDMLLEATIKKLEYKPATKNKEDHVIMTFYISDKAALTIGQYSADLHRYKAQLLKDLEKEYHFKEGNCFSRQSDENQPVKNIDIGNDEELVEKAIEIIKETKKASATLIQRRLGLPFSTASRLLDILEERKLIGPTKGVHPREVYI